MIWVWIVAGIVGVLALLLAVMHVLGKRLPEEHVAAVTLRLAKATPEAVWAVVADVPGYPSWSAVTRVEKLPAREGRETWRQTMGRNSFVLEVTRSERGRALEFTIADDAKMFSGSWLYEIGAAGGGVGGCTVRLTEHGRVGPAIPRFMMKHFMDPGMYVRKQHLKSLAKRMGEEGAAIERA